MLEAWTLCRALKEAGTSVRCALLHRVHVDQTWQELGPREWASHGQTANTQWVRSRWLGFSTSSGKAAF